MNIQVNAGAETESLLAMITEELSDEDLDTIEVAPSMEELEGLATEPVTIAAVITASGAVVATIATLVAKWLEARRQTETIELVLQGYRESPEAGDAILKLATVHAGVRVTSAELR